MSNTIDLGISPSNFSLSLEKKSPKTSFWDAVNLNSESGRNKFRRDYWTSHWDEIASQYGLSKDDLSLILPMLDAGLTDSDIFAYVQSLNASHQSEEKNSIASQVDDLRSVGYNPDLSGSLPSNGNAEIPSSPFSTADLPSNGGKGSLASKFTDIAGMLLKTMSFGLQAYGLVSNNLIQSAGFLSGLADKDVLSLFGNDEGVVEDVDSAIASLIASNGLKGRKAKQYARFVSNRINSTLNVASRLRQSSDKSVALYDSKINGFRSTDEYTDQVISFLRDSSSMQALMAEYDLKIQQQKLDWLNDHPDYTAEQLDTELANLRSGKKKASAEASKAVSEAGISAEHLEQEKIQTQTAKDEYPVKKLAASIRQSELEGISRMIDFCKEYQNDMSSVPDFVQKMDSTERGIKYRNNMRYLKDWYYKNKDSDNNEISSFIKLISKFIK